MPSKKHLCAFNFTKFLISSSLDETVLEVAEGAGVVTTSILELESDFPIPQSPLKKQSLIIFLIFSSCSEVRCLGSCVVVVVVASVVVVVVDRDSLVDSRTSFSEKSQPI